LIERRCTTRYNFGAVAEVIDLGSRKQFVAITRDLSQSGCFIKTATPFPEGTEVRVRITSSGADFTATGKVTGNMTSVGMAIEFVQIAASDQAILEGWLGIRDASLTEPSFLRLNRDERVIRGIPVMVSGQSSTGMFIEETETRLLTDEGALLTLAAPVSPGQVVRLKNRLTRTEQRCRVLFVDPTPGDEPKLLGVEFLESPHNAGGTEPES
jgi:PilZ domain